MKRQDVIFTVSTEEGSISVDMRYICSSQGKMMCAKGAIVDYLDTLVDKLDKEERQNTAPSAPNVNKSKIQETIDYALNQIKVEQTHGQYDYTEGLIKMARLSGVLTEGDFRDLMEHLESLKGYCDYQNDLRNVANHVSWEEVNGVDQK